MKYILRILYTLIALIAVPIIIGVAFLFYDEWAVKKKSQRFSEELSAGASFSEFLAQHSDFFSFDILKNENSRREDACLSIRAFKSEKFISEIPKVSKIDRSSIPIMAKDALLRPECRFVKMLYFRGDAGGGLWRASMSLIVTPDQRVEVAPKFNIYR